MALEAHQMMMEEKRNQQIKADALTFLSVGHHDT